MHELLLAIVSLYFCNKPIQPIIATPHTIQINGLHDPIYFLYRCLEVVTMHVCVIVDVACTQRYTRVYAKTHMSLCMCGFVCFS